MPAGCSKSLNEFHEVKVNWLHGDTLHNSLQAMLLISHVYAALRLPLAAKQYAIAVSAVASAAGDSDLHHLIPKGLFAAADCDYDAGAWISATDLTRVAVLAQNRYMPDLWNKDAHPYLPQAWTHPAVRVLTAQQIRPTPLPQLPDALENVRLGSIIDPPSLSTSRRDRRRNRRDHQRGVRARGTRGSTPDLFIVNLAFPSIAEDYAGVGLGELSWILNAYTIVFAAVLVPPGRWAD